MCLDEMPSPLTSVRAPAAAAMEQLQAQIQQMAEQLSVLAGRPMAALPSNDEEMLGRLTEIGAKLDEQGR